MLFLSTLVGYISRSTISVALPFIADDYGWTLEQQGFWGGILLGIFLVGYGFSCTFFSPLIDHYGPRKALFVSMVAWSFITFLTGLWGLVFGAFVMLRVALGLSQGVLFPSASRVARLHFPPSLRSRVNGFYMSSMFISNLLIGLLMLPLIQATDWQFALFVAAMIGYMLAIIILVSLEDDVPKDVKRPGMRESYAEIIGNIRGVIHIKGFWTVTLADAAMNLAWWGLSLWMPTYLMEAKGFSVDDLVWALPIIYVGGFLGIFIGSWLSDRLGHRSEITAVFSATGAAALMATLLVDSQLGVVISCFIMYFCISLLPANAYTLLQGIVPADKTGSATGVLNGVSNGLGVFGPILIGLSVALTQNFAVGIAIIALTQVAAALLIFSFRKYELPAE